jgi:putative membrane protein
LKRGGLLHDEARRAVGATVRAIETRTAAEVVVTVRARSAAYPLADLAWGTVVAFAALAFYVYFPITFADDTAPPAIALCFVGGVLLSRALDALQRLFVSKRAMREAVRLAARAAFVDQAIGSTRARSGVLVFVSLYERAVEVLPDVGVDVGRMGESWPRALADLEASVRRHADPAAFERALAALGDVLAASMPITSDDVNELPDEVAS